MVKVFHQDSGKTMQLIHQEMKRFFPFIDMLVKCPFLKSQRIIWVKELMKDGQSNQLLVKY